MSLAAVPVALWALLRRRPHTASVRALGIALGLALLAILFVYLSTPHQLDWHLSSSADRLLIQLWPTALLALFLALAPQHQQD